MRLIRDNRLFESILDDIEDVRSVQSSKVLSDNIKTRPDDYEVLVYFMVLIHSREQIPRLKGNIEKVADILYDSASSFRGVRDFAADILIPNPEYPENQTSYPHNLINNENAGELLLCWPVSEDTNLAEMTSLMENRITVMPKKGNIPVEFRLMMNLSAGLTLKTTAMLVSQMFNTMRRMITAAENLLRGQVSYMMKMGPSTYVVTKFRKDYASSFKKCFLNLVSLVPRIIDNSKGENPENYVKQYLNSDKEKDLRRMVMPEEISKLMTPHDLRYLAEFHPVVEIHGNVARMTTPEYVTMSIAGPYYLWYYIRHKYNVQHPGEPLTLEVYVNGTLTIGDDFYNRSDGDWYECIKFAKEVVSRSTEFRMLDLYLMKTLNTPKLVLINPMLQKTKINADEQVTEINKDRWKNPDVEIVSPTHDIMIEDVPRLPGKKLIKAIKK